MALPPRPAYDFHDLTSFLVGYYEGMSVLVTEPDFYELAYAYFEKAAAQGVVYAEIFFDPQGHTSRGVPFDTVIRGLRRAQLDARRMLGLHSQLIMCFLRDFQAEYAMATLLESLAVQGMDRRRRAGLRRAGQPAGQVRGGVRAGAGRGLPARPCTATSTSRIPSSTSVRL